MERKEVYEAIDSEREYQDKQVADPNVPNMVDLHLGDTLSAIQHNLDSARCVWYGSSIPYNQAMEYLRKIAALCVKAGEDLGMPKR